jgi:mannosyl-3-phosphoglycerate phosphatase
MCSSKTRTEILHYRTRLRVRDPFIAENGGAVFIPVGYFEQRVNRAGEQEVFEIIVLGVPYDALIRAVNESSQGVPIRMRGFHQMSAEELASVSGLSVAEARMSLDREYDEALILEGAPDAIALFSERLARRGLQVVRGGRFYHVTGGNDKGKAVEVLIERYRLHFSGVRTVGIGDSPNDIPMLLRVDIPILVKQPGGAYDATVLSRIPTIHQVKGIGPGGWNAAVHQLLDSGNLEQAADDL